MRRIRLPAALAVTVVALLVLYALWTRLRPPYVVAIGTPIRHDDFLFTVTHIEREPSSGAGTLYDIAIRVQNQARVVDYRWRDDIAYVRAFDDRGFGHDFFPLSRRAFVVRAGETADAHLQFRIPRDVSSPGLYFWDGIYMGDALNGAAYAKAVTPLAAYHPPLGT
jgi:hypothetical protein